MHVNYSTCINSESHGTNFLDFSRASTEFEGSENRGLLGQLQGRKALKVSC